MNAGETAAGPPSTEPEQLTYLHMLSLADLRPAHAPAVDFYLVEQEPGAPSIRQLTLAIGAGYDWPSQRWDDARWSSYLDRPTLRHWAAMVGGEPAGLLSLDLPPAGDVEIDTFGLLPPYVGRGIGGHFLTEGARLAWDVAPIARRIWLHTSSRDHPHALSNYEARGFRRFEPRAG